MNLNNMISNLIIDSIDELGRIDLFRKPLVSFSSANDPRYYNLKTIIGDWHLTPTEILRNAVSVISYFVPFTKKVVDAPKLSENASPLWSEAYQEINMFFNIVNSKILSHLNNEGYNSESISPTHTFDPKDLKCYWSHRSAAAIANLGTFGANRMLITSKGSGGRLCTVVTSAPLDFNSVPLENPCPYIKNYSCGLCFRVCPVGALKAHEFDKFTCLNKLNKNQKYIIDTTDLFSADACGKCVSVCPLAYIE